MDRYQVHKVHETVWCVIDQLNIRVVAVVDKKGTQFGWDSEAIAKEIAFQLNAKNNES